jgi:hypothetical protein
MASSAHAIIIAEDDFSIVGALVGSTPDIGAVWASHSGAGSKPIQVTGGEAIVVQSASAGEDVNIDWSGTFRPLEAGDTIYAAYDLTITGQGSPVQATYFSHFKDAGTFFNSRLGIAPSTVGGDYQLFISGDGAIDADGEAFWPTGLSFGRTYRVLHSYDFDTGSKSLWVDPINQFSPSVTASDSNFSDPMVQFALRQNTGGNTTQAIDHLRIATDFDEAHDRPFRGDFNEDFKVDAADYVVWRKNGANPLPNDGGAATANARFDLWRANFGNMAPGPNSETAGTPSLDGELGGGGSAATTLLVPGGNDASFRLNADGNWVWKVLIATSNPIPSGSSPFAAELGFKETASVLLDANNLSTAPGDDFDTAIPGTPIWGWENPGTGTNGFPQGLQSNCASGLCTEYTPGDDPNSVFAALGSQIFGAPTTADFIEIISEGPSTTGSLTTTIELRGAYGVGGNKGRVAEWNPAAPPDSINHDFYTGTFSFTAIPGDTNLDGTVDFTDFQTWRSNVGGANTRWQDGDFNDDEVVDGADYVIWLNATPLPGDFNFDGAVDAADYVVWRKGPTQLTQSGYDAWRANFGQTAAATANASRGVPEPNSLAIAVTAAVILLGCGGNKTHAAYRISGRTARANETFRQPRWRSNIEL